MYLCIYLSIYLPIYLSIYLSSIYLALELLHQFHKGPTGPLSGVWPTIDYLQNLTKDHIDLILKYSKWVLKLNPDEGIKVCVCR